MPTEANSTSHAPGTPISPALQARIEALVIQMLAETSALYEEGLTKQVALLTVERDALVERVRVLEEEREGRSPT